MRISRVIKSKDEIAQEMTAAKASQADIDAKISQIKANEAEVSKAYRKLAPQYNPNLAKQNQSE